MFGLLDGATELKDATVARDHGANAGNTILQRGTAPR